MGECGAGSIVWVRRRNGSWWPGKILGPDELSASHLISPRSGTPVKLLGREDASVYVPFYPLIYLILKVFYYVQGNYCRLIIIFLHVIGEFLVAVNFQYNC